jgi:inner membrane protein
MRTDQDGLMQRTATRISNSVTVKLIVIGIITLFLLIPASMIKSLVWERSNIFQSTVNEIGEKWGGFQTVTGPVLTVPYIITETASNGKTCSYKHFAHFLPERLTIDAKIEPVVRYRGIYKAVLYESTIKINGTFSNPDFARLNIPRTQVLFAEAFLSLGVPDMRGITKPVEFSWAGKISKVEPGIPCKTIMQSGVYTRVGLPQAPEEKSAFEFSTSICLNGSKSLHVIPVGKETDVKFSSPWSSPSFDGAFLPAKRSVTARGFEATWNILELNRNYPQSWTDAEYQFGSSAFGVSLLIPVDGYQLVTRSIKYAILFIVLTFVCFLLVEVLKKSRVHPVQYSLIGLALILFYALLLSFSEHIGFNAAYLLAAFGIVTMITCYVITVFHRKIVAVSFGAALTGLYGFLFIVLKMEDYALLMGSLVLFAVLGIFMYTTRKIDWYNLSKHNPN